MPETKPSICETTVAPYPWPFEKVRQYTNENSREVTIKGHLLLRMAVTFMVFTVRGLSWSWAYRFGTLIGNTLYRLRVRRKVAMTNLEIVFGDRKTQPEKEIIYKKSMQNFGRQTVNYLRTSLMDEKFWQENFSLANEKILTDSFNQGKGVLFLYMHFGPWEMPGGKISHSGYPVTVVAKKLKNPVIDNLVVKARNDMCLGTIMHRDVMKRIIEGLSKGEGIIMVMDQNMKRSQGVFVEFLGRTASTVRSAAYIARESGAPVVTGFARQTGPKSFEMTMTEKIEWVPDDDPDAELLINTKRYVQAIEKHILAMPEEWFWLHRRWKIQPGGIANPYDKK